MTLEPRHILYLQGIPQRVRDEKMFGMDNVARALMCALLTGGHVLLEGNPGLGKTALAKAMARAMRIGGEKVVGRIQFTPDLMPSDITGSGMPTYNAQNQMDIEFKEGPIFHQLLIADEINRATPKTQAAMLEAMGEGQVTVMGKSRSLRKVTDAGRGARVMTPFMVLATQNPIDQEGTYNLPEAQSDRFMMKIRMQNPDSSVLEAIVRKEVSPLPMPKTGTLAEPDPTMEGLIDLHEASVAVLSQELPPIVLVHVVNLVQASNGRLDQVRGLSRGRLAELDRWLAGRVVYPLGPRAASALARGALAWAAVTLADPDKAEVAISEAQRGLAAILVPVLRHRLRITETRDMIATSEGGLADALDDFLREFAVKAAPNLAEGGVPEGYHLRFEACMAAARTGIIL